ncbi:hypothetical protein [Acinetobacter pittii]|uniref:hypothetical protein n=1 Tax=Acinetobacter pittii TaxID=48296 RepID=UPI001FD69224|nr:hypothetical protein [Acinetobacter pittii]
MKATQFIKDHGLEKAREVVEGAPRAKSFISGDVKEAQGYNSKLSKYVMWDWLYKFHWNENDWQIHSYTWSEFIIDVFNLSDLKRLVESLDLVELLGGIDGLNVLLDMANSPFALSGITRDGVFYSSEKIKELAQVHESIYGGGDE